MNTLILKLNATGDVVRTTTLLRWLPGDVTWVTAGQNVELLIGAQTRLRCLSWETRAQACDRAYDLTINLEDDVATAAFAASIVSRRTFGAYVDAVGRLAYSPDSSAWFDLSLISTHGRARADRLKFLNRRTYQDLIFAGLGQPFDGERYVLPDPFPTGLAGDVAIAPVAGAVWPMKGWAYYDKLKEALESLGCSVHVLPLRPTLREHLGDIASHRCLVSGDSLPMHLALGLRVPCVTLFNCTSPWEIHDYGLQTKLVSPLIEQYFYKRDNDPEATRAIRLEDVLSAVLACLETPVAAPSSQS